MSAFAIWPSHADHRLAPPRSGGSGRPWNSRLAVAKTADNSGKTAGNPAVLPARRTARSLGFPRKRQCRALIIYGKNSKNSKNSGNRLPDIHFAHSDERVRGRLHFSEKFLPHSFHNLMFSFDIRLNCNL